MREIDRVLGDVAFVHQAGFDVDDAVGQHQRALHTGHVEHEGVAGAGSAAQPGLSRHRGTQQLVGVQAALHQGGGPAIAAQGDGERGRGTRVVRAVDHFAARQVKLALLGGRLHAGAGAHQHRHDQAGAGGLNGRAQRCGITGVGDGHAHRATGLRGVDQRLQMGMCRRMRSLRRSGLGDRQHHGSSHVASAFKGKRDTGTPPRTLRGTGEIRDAVDQT